MSEPSNRLRELAAHSRRIRAEMLQNRESRRSAGDAVGAGVDLLDYFFDLSGYKRTARHVGRLYRGSQLGQQRQKLEGEYEAWKARVRDELAGLSVMGKRVGPKGNSEILLQRFARTQRPENAETRLAHGIAFLEELAEGRVVPNEDVPQVLAATRAAGKRAVAVRVPGIDVLGDPDERMLAQLLGDAPSEMEALRGAIVVYGARTPDAGRQALNSCRNALENTVKRLSGEANWALGLEKLVPSQTRRMTVRQVYNYLSAYGTHGVVVPSDADVELGIRMTVSAIRSILAWTGTRE